MKRPEGRLLPRASTLAFFVVLELVVANLLMPSSGADLLVTTPRVSIGDVAVVEGDGPKVQMRFTVNLSEATANQVTIGYTTADGTASAPADYKAKTGTLTFKPGQTSKALSVVVFGDRSEEPAETLMVTLSSPTGGAVPGRMEGSGTIIEDDIPACSADQFEENDLADLASLLGAVAGDTGNQTIQTTATSCDSIDDDWYLVRVTENLADLALTTDLSLAIAVTGSASGKEYRISSYWSPGSVLVELGQIVTNGGQATLVLEWNDVLFGLDTREIYIEITPISGQLDSYGIEITGNASSGGP